MTFTNPRAIARTNLLAKLCFALDAPLQVQSEALQEDLYGLQSFALLGHQSRALLKALQEDL